MADMSRPRSEWLSRRSFRMANVGSGESGLSVSIAKTMSTLISGEDSGAGGGGVGDWSILVVRNWGLPGAGVRSEIKDLAINAGWQ